MLQPISILWSARWACLCEILEYLTHWYDAASGSCSCVTFSYGGEQLGLLVPIDIRGPFIQVASSYPTCIFVREKALLVSLERLRLIISKDQCIVLSTPPGPLVPPPPPGLHASPDAPFVKELVSRLKHAADR